MLDGAVKRYLDRVYSCKTKKVGTHTTSIKSQRKQKLGVKYKVLGVFPVYEYKEWEEYLTDWEHISLEQYSGITSIPNVDIAICIDEYNDVIYWRYAE